jgi:hypothetical protein
VVDVLAIAAFEAKTRLAAENAKELWCWPTSYAKFDLRKLSYVREKLHKFFRVSVKFV